MCARYQLAIDYEQFAAELAELSAWLRLPQPPPDPDAWRISYNVKPTEDVPAIRLMDGEPVLERLHWGWRPPGEASPGSKRPREYFNAKAETLARSFAGAFQRRQTCLIPATGFWEWGADRLPRSFRRSDGRCWLFAGLYARTVTSMGDRVTGCLIVTTTPCAEVAPIHNRMPVILDPTRWKEWLESPVTEALRPAPDGLLTATVAARFGIEDDGPGLLKPVLPAPLLFD